MRAKAVPKIVGGEELSQQEFYHSIVGILEHTGAAKPREVAFQLGENWAETKMKNLIGVTMSNMAKRGMLIKDVDGRYTVSDRFYKHTSRRTDETILQLFRDKGGILRRRDVLEAFGVRPRKEMSDGIDPDGRWNSDYGRVSSLMRSLEADGRLLRYFDGGWSLPWAELCSYPITGHWMNVSVRRGLINAVPLSFLADKTNGRNQQFEEEIPEAIVATIFQNVGSVLRELRTIWDIQPADLLAVEGVADLFQIYRKREFLDSVYAEMREIVDRDMERTYGKEPDKDGMNHGRIAAFEARLDEEREKVLEYHLLRFEHGEVNYHLNAPVELYYVIAKYFGVCPAGFSRGVLQFLPTAFV